MTNWYICTQAVENYGFHEGNNYWKFKGGDEYVVLDCERKQDAVAAVMRELREVSGANTAYMEFPLMDSIRMIETGAHTPYELEQLDYDGKVHVFAKRIAWQDRLPDPLQPLQSAVDALVKSNGMLPQGDDHVRV